MSASKFDPSSSAGGAHHAHPSTPARNTSLLRRATVGLLFAMIAPLALSGADLWTWGENPRGQLGDGSTADRDVPVRIATDATGVAAGVAHSLFIREDGTAWAMGANESGQLGDGSNEDRATPVAVALAKPIVAVAAGRAHSLFLTATGDLYGCGSNHYGPLGLGDAVERVSSPTLIDTDVEAIQAGIYHSLYLKSDGSLWGSGSNHYGELGLGSGVSATLTPAQIATGVGAIDTGAGGFYSAGWYFAPFSVFLTDDGVLHGMGSTYTGQLGQLPGDAPNGLIPDPREIAQAVTAFSANSHLVYREENGTVHTLGRNHDGVARFPGVAVFYDGFDPAAHVLGQASAGAELIAAPFHTFILDEGELTSYSANGNARDGASAPAAFTSSVIGLAASPGGRSAGFTVSELNFGHYLLLAESDAFEAWPPPSADIAEASIETVPPRPIEIEVTLGNARGTAVVDWFRGTRDDPEGLLVNQNALALSISPFGGAPIFFSRIITPQGPLYAAAPAVHFNHDYTAWCDAYGLTGDDRSADADPDGDLVENAVEHQLLTPPDVAGDLPVTISYGDESAWLDAWVRADATAPAVTFSTDLRTWSAADGSQVEMVSDSGARELRRFVFQSSTAQAAGNVFARFE